MQGLIGFVMHIVSHSVSWRLCCPIDVNCAALADRYFYIFSVRIITLQRGLMPAKNGKDSKKWVWAALIALIALSLYIVRPFLTLVVISAMMAYIFTPTFRALNRRIASKSLAAMIVVMSVLIVLLVPAAMMINTAIAESADIYSTIATLNIDDASGHLSEYLGIRIDLSRFARESASRITTLFAESVYKFAMSIPRIAISVFVVIFTFFYLLRDGDKIIRLLKANIPLDEKRKAEMIWEVEKLVRSIAYGVFVIAMIQGVLGLIGFAIFHMPSPFLWGMIMTVAAMIPFIGPWVVWLPFSLLKLASGEYFDGIGLFIYGTLLVGLIDNLLRPMIISDSSKTHPAVILLGIIGGVSTLGVAGFVVGPLVLGLLFIFLKHMSGVKL